jgi:GT2 family glycosyltransferase
MTLWVCIPVHNRISFTEHCLEALHAQDFPDFRVVVCDDGSTDGTSERIRLCFPDVIVLDGDGTLWWTGAINRCVEYVLKVGNPKTDAVITLNNDLEVETDYLSALAGAARRHPHAIIASAGYDIRTHQLVAPGLRQSWLTSKVSIVGDERDRLPNDADLAEVTHAPGRGTLVPLRAFHDLGLYDQQHLPHYGADYDYTHRARRAGYRILISYRAQVFSHIEETGMTAVRRDFGLKGLYRYLTDIKSPANLSARWWLAVNNCPRLLLPSYLVLDFLFVVSSYFKYHVMKTTIGRGNA